MDEFLIPDVDDAIIARLEARAAKAGKSLEQLVCEILTEAANPDGPVILDAAGPEREQRDGR
jgi:plasmid stability protein